MGRKAKYVNINPDVTKLYKSKASLKRIDINDFQDWYNSKNGCCQYCKITSAESLLLFHKYPESTRGGRRGKRLELDRINPTKRNYGSDIKNLALACYWCNNAKTNYFTYTEFKIIGKTIAKVQKKRIMELHKSKKH